CQYTFAKVKDFIEFDEILESRLELRYHSIMFNYVTIDNVTCYTGLTCKTLVFCLDWKQICDGVADCENAEDEQNCLELETNECDRKTEYRCRNGMCIVREFAFDLILDCMDGSDELERKLSEPRKIGRPYVECEEYKWSTGRPNYICKAHLMNSLYANLRFNLYHKRLHRQYVSDNKSLLCEKYMICKVGFNGIVSSECIALCKNIETSCSSLIRENCLSPFFFPANPVAYPSVRFLYFTNITEWDGIGFTPPKYICYDDTICSMFPTAYTIYGYHCRATVDFGLPSNQQYDVFHNSMARIFSTCLIHNTSCNQLFQCKLLNNCISKYRLNDLYNDCFFGDDETYENIQSLNLSDRITCISHTSKELHVPSWLYDHHSVNCLPIVTCESTSDGGCDLLRNVNLISPYHYLFQEICNGIENNALTDKNETDETNCYEFYHLCSARRRSCNGQWDCATGIDEICTERPKYCPSTEHLCFKSNNYQQTCLDRKYVGDGVIDCVGGTDERLEYCPHAYPSERNRRFWCKNSSQCLLVDKQVCDGYYDCPLRDDEVICPSRNKSECPTGMFACTNGNCVNMSKRCDGQPDCDRSAEDELFCDLLYVAYSSNPFGLYKDFNQYPFRDEVTSLSFNAQNHEIVQNKWMIQQTRNIRVQEEMQADLGYYYGYYCNLGVVVNSRDHTADKCLCSPNYYGDRCEFQSERLTVYFQAKLTKPLDNDIFKFLICLIAGNDTTVTCEYVVHFSQNNVLKHIVYLEYPREKHSLGNFFVRIFAFSITMSNITFHSAWYFRVTLQFLPVNRLTTFVLINVKKGFAACNRNCVHGSCIVYRNIDEKSFCLCDDGWLGPYCDVLSSITCANGSRSIEGQCLCTLGRIGPGCYIQNGTCSMGRCENGGTCFPIVETFEQICVCHEGYSGSLCQYPNAHVLVRLSDKPSDRTIIRMPIVVVHLLDIDESSSSLLPKNRSVYKNIHFDTVLSVYYRQEVLPAFIYVQLFYNTDTFHGLYYLVSFIRHVRTLHTSVLPSNRCPHVSELLNSTINQLLYLKRVKYYQRACYTLGVKCFFDDKYMCLCDNFVRYDCLLFDHDASNCTGRGYCLNGGHCAQSAQVFGKNTDFACVCARCFYGDLCQFTTAQYSQSLDAFTGPEILTGKPLRQQPVVIKIILTSVIVLVVSGLIINLLSIITFSRKRTHEVGCGFYLLLLCIISQLGILTLGARFTYLIVTQISGTENKSYAYVSCVALEFLLSVLLSGFDWLTACIAVERAFNAVKGTKFNKKLSKKVSKYVGVMVIVLTVVSSLHEPFNRHIIDDPRSNGYSWCVMQFDTQWLKTYETISNIVHLTTPFLINLVSTTVFLISLARRKSASTANTDNYYMLLKKQITLYKPFVVSPVILIIVELPRLVSSFAFACIEFPWQKYIYLVSYFVSFIPLMGTIIIFVLPAPVYREELSEFLRSTKTRFTRFSQRP
ncbi:unnamed protein product, partial [Didymodactylos carnosus]